MTVQVFDTGKALRHLRRMSGMTLEAVAQEAGTSVAYLSKVERGKHQPTAGYVGLVTGVLAQKLRKSATKMPGAGTPGADLKGFNNV